MPKRKADAAALCDARPVTIGRGTCDACHHTTFEIVITASEAEGWGWFIRCTNCKTYWRAQGKV